MNLHTWRVVGDAPSVGKGKRVELRCVHCRAGVVVRLRMLKNGYLRPCRCQDQAGTTPTNTNPKENNA